MTTLAGAYQEWDLVDGRGVDARFSSITGLARDRNGGLLVLEASNGILRRIDSDDVTVTIAGQLRVNGSVAVDGVGGAARLNWPHAIATDAAGNLYLGEGENEGSVRKGVPVAAESPPILLVGTNEQSQRVGARSPCRLRAPVSAVAPALFQWFLNDVALPGARSETLELAHFAAEDVGVYSVTASNGAGSVTVRAGELTIYEPPLMQFVGRHAKVGGSFLWGIAAGAGRLVAVGLGGTVLTSADGMNWEPMASGTAQGLRAVTRGAKTFVAVGDAGTILLSEDGRQWQPVESGTKQRLNNVIYGQALYVAVGEAGTIITSPDAKTWTKRESGTTGWLRGISCNFDPGWTQLLLAWGRTQPSYVAAGQDGQIVESVDGTTWTLGRSMGNDLETLTTSWDFFGAGADGATAYIYRRYVGKTVPLQIEWLSGQTPAKLRLRGSALALGVIWVTGEDGAILAAPDGAGPWATLASGTTANLVAATSVGNTLYVVGENETILQSMPLSSSRLVNLSSRGRAGRDAATLISGFVINGNRAKSVLLRAVGPGLKRIAGFTNVVARPQLTLTDARGGKLAVNADWAGENEGREITEASVRVGGFPLVAGDRDAALLVTLQPGLYTTQVSAQEAAEGLCLIEAYDADLTAADVSRAINLSTRSWVGTGDDILIAGFVLGGDSPRRVLIRGAGPALKTRFGITDALTAVHLNLASQWGYTLQAADAWWRQSNADEIRNLARWSGAFAFDEGSADAAIVTTLNPGIYTVQLSGVNNTTGVALVEIYDLP